MIWTLIAGLTQHLDQENIRKWDDQWKQIWPILEGSLAPQFSESKSDDIYWHLIYILNGLWLGVVVLFSFIIEPHANFLRVTGGAEQKLKQKCTRPSSKKILQEWVKNHFSTIFMSSLQTHLLVGWWFPRYLDFQSSLKPWQPTASHVATWGGSQVRCAGCHRSGIDASQTCNHLGKQCRWTTPFGSERGG